MSQTEIQKLQEEIERLKTLLNTDELTQAANRRGLMEGLKPVVKEVEYQIKNPNKRKNLIITSFSLVFVDVDHFKNVNDSYGHPAGDEVLKKIAQILRENVRGVDVVGRYGGEEMVIGLLGADKRDAVMVAENLREKIERTEVSFEGKTIKVTASFGIAQLDSGMSVEKLIENADKALYEAKETGRNKVVAI